MKSFLFSINFYLASAILYSSLYVVFGNRRFGQGNRGQHFRPVQSGGNSWGQSHWGTQNQNSNAGSSCPRPTFSDEVELVIDNCNQGVRNGHSHVCSNSETNIPSHWKATMMCKHGSVTLRYVSTCSSSGDWEPAFYESCQQLRQQSLGDIGEDTGGQSNNQAQNPEPIPVSVIDDVDLRPCFPLQVQTSKNFIYTCKFPGQADSVEGCKTSEKYVNSGTVATLKCRPPFSSQNGLFSQWTCENGKWVGESRKVVCFYSSSGNQGQTTPQPYEPKTTPAPVVVVTTKAPIVVPVTNPPPQPPKTTVRPISGEERVTCPALKHRSPGVKVECVSSFGSGGATENVCEEPQPVGTEAKYSCLSYYEAAGGLSTIFRKCREDGRWTGSSETFSCVVGCGRANQVQVAFITNGLPTVRGQWPWHAAMFLHEGKQNKWSYICGGTLIGKRAILTAAHCVTLVQTTHLRPVNTLRIDFGKYRREEIDDLVQSSDVKSIFVHPSYNPYGYDSDIAIITLKTEIKIGYHVRPICFPQTSDSALEGIQLSENSIGTVVGFGYNENHELAEELQMARLRVIGPRECSETFKSEVSGQIQTRSTTYCAGYKNGTNVCNGDSGSGMYFPSKHSDQTKWYLQGLVSVGIADEDGKCDPKQLSVFTRVGRYADWLVRTLSENDAT